MSGDRSKNNSASVKKQTAIEYPS
jgi:hypothetical protein